MKKIIILFLIFCISSFNCAYCDDVTSCQSLIETIFKYKQIEDVKHITDDEVDAYYEYTSPTGYMYFNSPLRRGEPPTPEILSLDKLISRFTLDNRVVLFRGSDEGWYKKNIDVGESFQDLGYTSTAYEKEGSLAFIGGSGLTDDLELSNNPNSPVLYILYTLAENLNAISVNDIGEKEVVLQRGLSFLVKESGHINKPNKKGHPTTRISVLQICQNKEDCLPGSVSPIPQSVLNVFNNTVD